MVSGAGDRAQRVLADAMREFGELCAGFGSEFSQLDSPGSELDTIEGYRLYSRYLSIGIDRFVEYVDPAFPAFYSPSRDGVRKFAGDSPAQLYDNSPVSSEFRYEVTGSLDETALIEFTVYSGEMSGSGGRGRRLVASLTDEDLEVSDSGDFVVRLAQGAEGRNSLALDDDSKTLVVRRYVRDPLRDRPRPLSIRRLGPGPAAPTVTAESHAEGMVRAARFALANVEMWAKWVSADRESKFNALTSMADAGDIHTPKGHRYLNGYWSVRPGTALTIAFSPPTGSYWSFVPMNFWMESLEWRFGHKVFATSFDTEPGPDGVVRLVLAAEDPGLPGHRWIEIGEHVEGTMSLRYGRCDEPVRDAQVELIGSGGNVN